MRDWILACPPRDYITMDPPCYNPADPWEGCFALEPYFEESACPPRFRLAFAIVVPPIEKLGLCVY